MKSTAKRIMSANAVNQSVNAELALLILQQQQDAAGEFTFTLDGVNVVSLEDAGLEELQMQRQPLFGNTLAGNTADHLDGSVIEYLDWANDGEDSRYECN